MSTVLETEIPYEQQADPQDGRMCGAAALSMVYQSLGKPATQADLWPKISKYNRFGSLTAASHRIAQVALDEGFVALAIQARYPLQALRTCRDNGIRAILNHRLKEDVPTGHFSVLVDVDDEAAILHDPYFGPSRRVPHAELIDLWNPRYLNAEITGNVLIGIAPPQEPAASCRICGTAIPASIDCPNCKNPVPLQPAVLLGCVGAGCAARLWNYICCPACDHTWNFAAAGTQVADASDNDPWKLTHAFGELDKFLAQILTSPRVASHPDVVRQLEFIKTSQEKLKLAQTEMLIRRQTLKVDLEKAQEKCAAEKQAVEKNREDAVKPAPSLDGNALGMALLKDLDLLGSKSVAQTRVVPTTDADIVRFLRKKGLLQE
jgi:hypothetical protein